MAGKAITLPKHEFITDYKQVKQLRTLFDYHIYGDRSTKGKSRLVSSNNFRDRQNNVRYYNIACSFDVETTSIKTPAGHRHACVYAFMVDIDGYCFLMREWDHVMWFFDELTHVAKLNPQLRLAVYVHNLSFEFEFIKHRFGFHTEDSVFAMDVSSVVTARTDESIEFRCSLKLSGKKLASLAGDVRDDEGNEITKMVGDLDYDLPRHSKTPVTEKELGYMLNDVLIVEYYIKGLLRDGWTIGDLPKTSTGFTRTATRENTIGGATVSKGQKKDGRDTKETKAAKKKYREKMQQLTMEPKEAALLRMAFAGGFTHAALGRTMQMVLDMESNDYTSSYPAVMCAKKYPMTKGVLLKVKDEGRDMERFSRMMHEPDLGFVFAIRFINLRQKEDVYENYLSASKGQRHPFKSEGVKANNGRVYKADVFECAMCDVDYRMCELAYDWDSIVVTKVWMYKLDYLPRSFIMSVLTWYSDKTKLKDVEGMEDSYRLAKERVNALYGMCAMDPIRDDVFFNGETGEITVERVQGEGEDFDEKVTKVNDDKKRFTFYPWALYITAYARENLFMTIIKLKDKYGYSDTDSIKYTPDETTAAIFEADNVRIIGELKAMCDHYNISYDLIEPEDIKGHKHMLGVWDFDGKYIAFKTLGAKRYLVAMYGKKGDIEIKLTMAGVNKKTSRDYLLLKAVGIKTDKEGKLSRPVTHDDIQPIMDLFDDDLTIPATHSGKNIVTRVDEVMMGELTDYLGNKHEYYEYSGVHITTTEYHLGIPDEYTALANLAS